MKKNLAYLVFVSLLIALLISCASTGDMDYSIELESEKEITPANLVLNGKNTKEEAISTSSPETTVILPEERVIGIVDGEAVTNVSIEEALAAGFDFLDIITITSEDVTITAPIVENTDVINQGEYYITLKEGNAVIGKKGEDSGLKINMPISFSLSQQKGFETEYIMRNLYPVNTSLTGFYEYEAASMKKGHLYTVYAPLVNEENHRVFLELLKKHEIKTIINFSEAAYLEGVNLQIYQPKDVAEALHMVISSDDPYLIIVGSDEISRTFPALLEALMGARLEQIASDCIRPYANYYGIEEGSSAYNLLDSILTSYFCDMNNGEVPRDKSLLALAVDYLKNGLGFKTDEIASVRLALR